MIESFYKAFEDFVVEFSGRRLAGALLLAVVGLGGFAIIDRYSPYFIMGRLERATGLLERVASLDRGGGLDEKSDLQSLRLAIIEEARRLVEPVGAPVRIRPTGVVALWKFGSGIAPWLLFALFAFLPNARKDPSNWSGVVGALFVGLLFGSLALLIPDAWVTWGVLIGYSLGHFFCVVVVVLAWQARQRAKSLRTET